MEEADARSVYFGFYVKRGEASENRIKEVRNMCFSDRLSDHGFWANFLRLFLSSLAYEIFLLLKGAIKKEKIKCIRILYIIGIVALIIGVLDPLEGSVVIASGNGLIALATYLTHDRNWKIFLGSMIMIVVGVIILFYLSSLGGFGGKSSLSWWWGLLIVPYPVGWLMAIITLIVRTVKKQTIKPA